MRSSSLLLVCVSCFSLISLFLVGASAGIDPDAGVGMVALVERRGYSIERHYVTTDDGYVLGMFRIPRGRNEYTSRSHKRKPVVFLQHALLDSSIAFCLNFANQSLAFILADAGFDVWLGNNRGNTYSTNHTTLDPKSSEFWAFTFDEMASKDLPAQVSYVLASTGVASLSYVGHSEGTIQAFAGLALESNAAVAEKINLVLALAPVAYVHNQRGALLNLIADLRVDEVVEWFGDGAFLPSDTFLNKIAPGLCKLTPGGCDAFIELVVGPSKDLNESRIGVYTSYTPAGTSTRNMVHVSFGAAVCVSRFYFLGNASPWQSQTHHHKIIGAAAAAAAASASATELE